MTRRVLFVQGAGEGTHDRWDNELVESLRRELGDRYTVRYPRMPDEDDPQYSAWKATVFDELESLGDGAILVGHSVGGAFLIHALAEQRPKPRLNGIFLIAAPFIGTGGWQNDDIRPLTNLAEPLPVSVPIFLYHGVADEIVPIAHVHLYAKAIPHAVVRTVEHGDHQLNNELGQVARDIRLLTPV